MFTIYSADVTGNPGNCSYPHKHVVLDDVSLEGRRLPRLCLRRVPEQLPQALIKFTD